MDLDTPAPDPPARREARLSVNMPPSDSMHDFLLATNAPVEPEHRVPVACAAALCAFPSSPTAYTAPVEPVLAPVAAPVCCD
jgi:hypothetical protein